MACSPSTRCSFTVMNIMLGVFALFLITLCSFVIFEKSNARHAQVSANATVTAGLSQSSSERGRCGNLCVSKSCVKGASLMLHNNDQTVGPCDNFYRFACGKFPEDSSVVSGQSQRIAMEERAKVAMYSRLRDIILSSDGEEKETYKRKRKTIYDTCLKSNDVKSESKSLLTIVRSIVKNWPQKSFTYEDDDVDEWLTKLALLDAFAFFTLEVRHTDFGKLRKFSRRLADIIPTDLETKSVVRLFPQFTFLSKNSTDCEIGTLRQNLTDLLMLTGLSAEDSESIVFDACHVDTWFRELAGDFKWQGDIECENNTSRWCNLISAILETAGSNLHPSRVLTIIELPKTFLAIDNMLKRNSSSIANYLSLRFLHSNMKSLEYYTKEGKSIPEEFEPKFGDPNFPDRRLKCVYFITRYLPFTLVNDYLQLINAQQKLAVLENMYDRIKQAAIFRTNSSSFSSEFKRVFSISVSKAELDTAEYIKYVSEAVNLTESLHHLSPHIESFALNLVEAKRFKQFDNIRNYLHGYYFLSLRYSNEFYVGASSGDSIIFGLGLLELGLDGDLPTYMDFGQVGSILAHELGHSVTSTIYRFKRLNTSDADVFKKFENCLEDTYGRYMIPYVKTPVNGTQTYIENLADFIGVTISHDALLTFISEETRQNKLPGFNNTSEQQFFISYADVWCEFGDFPGFERYLKDIHCPSEHRVNGPLMSSEAFSKSFRCPVGSNMNPVRKCKLWP